MRFLQRHLPIAGRLEPDAMIRKDEPLFPVSALREALVNAICHRDYVAPGGSISTAVYDDRVEIWSTGLLPAGISIDDLSKSHESKPRNPLIADVFYFRGLVERWGEGTRNIITACQQAGHPTPEFIEQSGAIGVRFLMATTPQSGEDRKQDLSPRQACLIEVITQLESATRKQLKAKIKDAPTDRTLQRDLDILKRLGVIEALGQGSNVAYRLKKR